MPYFLDTSALVKLYVREPGTEAILRFLDATAASGALVISALAAVEFAAALKMKERSGALTTTLGAELLARFQEHLGWQYAQQAVTDSVLQRAAALVQRHPLRAYNAVQLASAAIAGQSAGDPPLGFICSDQQLLAAARAEGLSCFDPLVGS
jgi:hypothetical protein